MEHLEIRTDFSPCDLCPSPHPGSCPAEHHTVYCEYIEAEARKPESLRYYTRYLRNEPNPEYTVVKADLTGVPSREAPAARQSISMETYNIALANARTCPQAVTVPRSATSCCKRRCKTNRYPDREYVSRKDCLYCQFEIMGVSHP